jgi:WD40 repeat protein
MDFDPFEMEMYLFLNKTFRIIDLFNGQIKHIFSFKNGPADEEFTIYRYFSGPKKIVLGTSNGDIAIYSGQTGELEANLKTAHEGAVSFIEYDEFNKLYITVGYDSKILVHRASDGSMLR